MIVCLWVSRGLQGCFFTEFAWILLGFSFCSFFVLMELTGQTRSVPNEDNGVATPSVVKVNKSQPSKNGPLPHSWRFLKFSFSIFILCFFYVASANYLLAFRRCPSLYLVFYCLCSLYWVSLGFTGFYWVLLGFTGFYRVLLGFY